MIENQHYNSAKITIGCILWIGLLLSGCEQSHDEYSFPPMILSQKDFLRQIRRADNLLDLDKVRKNYILSLNRSAEVGEKIKEKWDKLTRQMEREGETIGRLCDEAELIQFDFEKIGFQRYRLHYLFRVLKPFSTDCGIYLIGRLPPPDRNLLPEKDRKKGYLSWHFNPLPPTSFWEEGKYLVINQDITAPNLPFQLALNLDTPRGRHGIQLPLGTMAHLRDQPFAPELAAKINDIFQLYELTRYCHARSGSAGKQIKRHYRELLSRSHPKTSISDSLNFYGWKFKNLGSGYSRIYLLFKVLKPLDHDYWLAVHGLVAPSDRDKLSAPRRKKGKKSEQWTFLPSPPPTSWQPRGFIMLTRDIPVEPIQYDLFALFYDRRDGAYGKKFDLGKITAD